MKREDGYNGSGSVPEDGYSSLSVATKRQELYYGPALLDMVSIDLSSNCLIGGIPEQIASLAALKNLNLSRNNLNGKIPYKIGSLQSLESLDLSRNNLSGEIPSTLSNLSYLSDLDLSYNNLSGTIPSGSQLGTLYMEHPDMYNGNNGLCGPPLRRNCSGDIEPRQHGYGDDNKAGHVPEPMFFYLGLVSGFIAGLWVVFCIILFKKTWRIAYFRIFDKVENGVAASRCIADGGGRRIKQQAAAAYAGRARDGAECEAVSRRPCASMLGTGPRAGLCISPRAADEIAATGAGVGAVQCAERQAHRRRMRRRRWPPSGMERGARRPEALAAGISKGDGQRGRNLSYGILVLETVTGKRPSDSKFTQGLSLCESVSLGLHGKVMDIVDNKLCLGIDQHDPETTDDFSSKQKIDCLISLLKLGLSCSQEMPSSRLSTGDIIKELHAIKESLLLEIEDTEK
uniref:Leucine-rich repeat-containing N-terminal plant-type domain-containing protein n=1 Tax=Oryza glumipatula TaxID=40148 RepID=A0A0E0BKE3_9ORYZ